MRAKKARAERVKGALVEQIVEEMHYLPGVRVERNVYLPSKQIRNGVAKSMF